MQYICMTLEYVPIDGLLVAREKLQLYSGEIRQLVQVIIINITDKGQTDIMCL